MCLAKTRLLFIACCIYLSMKKIRRCEACRKFMLEEKCCGANTKSVHPPHYNPHDKYAYIRRKEKSVQ